MRAHASLVREYESLKRELAPRFSAAERASRQAYADAKGEFIERVIRQAFADGYC